MERKMLACFGRDDNFWDGGRLKEKEGGWNRRPHRAMDLY